MAKARNALGASQEVELRLAKAMAHPVRVRALELLSHRPMAPVEVADALNMPLSNVSYHFRTLRDLECIKPVGRQQVRGIEAKATGEWGRAILESTATRISDAIEAKTIERRENIQFTVQSLEVTEEQFSEISNLMDGITERLAEIKSTNSDADPGVVFPATFSMMGYESPKLYEQ